MKPTPKPAEERIVDLEIRYTELEDTLQKLDGVVREQQEEIERLAAGLNHYSQRVKDLGGEVAPRDLADDKPPHY